MVIIDFDLELEGNELWSWRVGLGIHQTRKGHEGVNDAQEGTRKGYTGRWGKGAQVATKVDGTLQNYVGAGGGYDYQNQVQKTPCRQYQTVFQ